MDTGAVVLPREQTGAVSFTDITRPRLRRGRGAVRRCEIERWPFRAPSRSEHRSHRLDRPRELCAIPRETEADITLSRGAEIRAGHAPYAAA